MINRSLRGATPCRRGSRAPSAERWTSAYVLGIFESPISHSLSSEANSLGPTDPSLVLLFMDRDEIDHILRRRRKPAEKACYPCHRRKVRCNHAQPCSTCQRRGHPEICSYSFSTTKRREKRRRSGVDSGVDGSAIFRRDDSEEAIEVTLLTPSLEPSESQPAAENSLNSPNGEVSTPEDDTYQGHNSIISMLRLRPADSPLPSRVRDARVFFGLQNSVSSDLLFTTTTAQQRWEALIELSPQNEEFHRYSISDK